MHHHIWKEKDPDTPRTTKTKLLSIIRRCGISGYWLKPEEVNLGKKLAAEGNVRLCCNGHAATICKKVLDN